MYGLVNKAIRDLVVSNYGEQKWSEICALSDFPDEEFVAMSPYPDELTFALVTNASRVLGADARVILQKFGEYWITYTATEGYGELMNLSGRTISEFLSNMDMLHNRIANVMPELQPPKFVTRNITDRSLELEYHTHRSGLVPMMFGMLHGLGQRFGVECQVEHIHAKEHAGDCDIFRVSW